MLVIGMKPSIRRKKKLRPFWKKSAIRFPAFGWGRPRSTSLPETLVYQIVMPRSGPLDPVPVFTYNSLAARAKSVLGPEWRICSTRLSNRSINGANVITGTGRYLEYEGSEIDSWMTAPASTRNALKQNSDLTWTEQQPDGLEWHYRRRGLLGENCGPAGTIWSVVRTTILSHNDCPEWASHEL